MIMNKRAMEGVDNLTLIFLYCMHYFEYNYGM